MSEGVVDDEQSIIALTIAYCWALDEGDYSVLREVFTPDATAELGSSNQSGVDEIIERVSAALARFVATQHIVATHEVQVDGDRATCRCYLQAQHVRPDGEEPQLLTVGGRYDDEMVRTPAGWRIAHRTLTSIWRSGVQ